MNLFEMIILGAVAWCIFGFIFTGLFFKVRPRFLDPRDKLDTGWLTLGTFTWPMILLALIVVEPFYHLPHGLIKRYIDWANRPINENRKDIQA